MSPLSGLRVLDISTILAGPLCCQILGDFGADVIKIEHPVHGDGLRGHGPRGNGIPLWWKEVNRNKRTIAVDLGVAEGAAIARTLAADADVLVENFRPGTLERWGLDPNDLLQINPRLVIARVTGWGQTGPYAHRPGFGTLAEAMSGFAHLTGPADGPPTLPAFGLADTICGITASAAILTALYHRDARDGEGQVIDINLLEPIMTAVGPSPTVYEALGEVETRHGNRSTNNAPRNTYRTSDGHWVAVSSSAHSVATRVLELVGHPEVTEQPWFTTGHGRAEHVELIDELVGAWVAQRSRDEVLSAFDAVSAAVAPVADPADIVKDPHIRQTEMLTYVADEDFGQLLQHNVLWRMSQTPGAIRFTGRALGQDTDSILLGECGIDADNLGLLRAEQVIA